MCLTQTTSSSSTPFALSTPTALSRARSDIAYSPSAICRSAWTSGRSISISGGSSAARVFAVTRTTGSNANATIAISRPFRSVVPWSTTIQSFGRVASSQDVTQAPLPVKGHLPGLIGRVPVAPTDGNVVAEATRGAPDEAPRVAFAGRHCHRCGVTEGFAHQAFTNRSTPHPGTLTGN